MIGNKDKTMLEITDLKAGIDGKPILRGIDLKIGAGEVHAIMGPNGSGKSTLANVLAGREEFEVTEGQVKFNHADLLEMEPEERATAGIFLAFQYPVSIPGVPFSSFLRHAINAQRKARDEEELDTIGFSRLIRQTAQDLEISADMLKRAVNVGFSGGEKKRAEILQMAVLQPRFAVLDETDSGLDIDALKVVADGVNRLRTPQRSFLVITHYQRLLDYIKPDHVHVLAQGRIVKSGGPELAQELEEKGYGELLASLNLDADAAA